MVQTIKEKDKVNIDVSGDDYAERKTGGPADRLTGWTGWSISSNGI